MKHNEICPSCGATMKLVWLKDEDDEIIGSKLHCDHCGRDDSQELSDEALEIKLARQDGVGPTKFVLLIGLLMLMLCLMYLVLSMN